MARSVYSKHFGDVPGISAPGQHTVFTVPPGFVAVVRDVAGLQTSPTGDAFLREATSTTSWVHWESTRALQSFQWQGDQVFEEGSQIGLYVGSGSWSVRFCGFLLAA